MYPHHAGNTFKVFLFLILQLAASTSFAQNVYEHTCRFDELNLYAKELQVVQELPNSGERNSVSLSTTGSDGVWKPIRIRFSTTNIDDTQKTCPHAGTRRKDPYNELTLCEVRHLLTSEKRKDLNLIIRSAIKMHSDRLNVTRIENGFTVPEFEKGFCSRFTIPENHKTTGVQNTDMMLYVATFPSRTENFFAASAPCATLQNGRPVVGVLSFNPRYIEATPYVVRVAAHEMAHTLGFTYDIIKKHTKVERKSNIRWKAYVTEVRGSMTVNATRRHFGDSSATGMELEDEQGVLKAPSRSHWERRNARDELMAGIVNRGDYSAFTLGLFQDLGFYRVNFSKSEEMVWGKNEGYNFLNWACFMFGKNYFPNHFCKERGNDILHCTHDKRGMGMCTGVIEYNSRVPYQYNYFNEMYESGHRNLLTDRCPIIQQQADGDCRGKGPTTIPGLRAHDAECMPKAHSWWYYENITKKNHKGLCAVAWNYYRTPYVFVENYLKLEPCYEKDLSAKVQYENKTFAVQCPRRRETEAYLKSLNQYDSVLLDA